MSYIIYKHTNTITGKAYIGQTKYSMMFRWNSHLSLSKRKDFYFYRAIRKYGKDVWQHEVLFETDDPSIIDEKEREYIAEHDTYGNGYNSTPGGAVLRGPDNPWFGKSPSKETRRKLSKAAKNRTVSEETKQKLSKRAKERGFGKHKRPVGVKSINADKTIYKWKNIKTGEVYYGTRYDLADYIGVRLTAIRSYFHGGKTIRREWVLDEHDTSV